MPCYELLSLLWISVVSLTECRIFLQLTLKCVCAVFCNCCSPVKWQTSEEQIICIKFCFKWFLKLTKQFKQHFVLPSIRHKPLNYIRVSKVAKLQVRILIIQLAHHQFRRMKMRIKHIRVVHEERGYTINGVCNSTGWHFLTERSKHEVNCCKIFVKLLNDNPK